MAPRCVDVMPVVNGAGPDHGLAVLDDQARLALAGGDASLAAELLDIFRREILPEAENLPALAEATDRCALAHKVRGAALAIGAAEIAAVALRIESGGAFDADLPLTWSDCLGRLRQALAEAANRGRGG